MSLLQVNKCLAAPEDAGANGFKGKAQESPVDDHVWDDLLKNTAVCFRIVVFDVTG